MINPSPIRTRAGKAIPQSEQGYTLLMVMFVLAIMVLWLAAAAPQVAKSIQRDRDLETFHRGMQYRRAIQLDYRKMNHTYPPSVDALVMTNKIRFLRKKYVDPTTGKDVWKPVLFGQNKTPTAMGFFGEPLTGSTIAGTGPSGGNGMVGLPGMTSGIGGSSGAGSNSTTTNGSTDNSGGTNGSGGASGATGSSTSGTSSSQSGQTFGGAGIIGFSPGSSRQSILVYKKKNHYDEWEFTYDPLSDQKMMSGGNTGSIGQPASSTTNPVGSNPLSNSNNNSNGPLNGTQNPGSMPPDMPAPQPQ